MTVHTNQDVPGNVAVRFRRRLADAKQMGFDVRLVTLDDQVPGWCSLGGKRVAFIDVTSTTTEQLGQLDGILEDFLSRRAA